MQVLLISDFTINSLAGLLQSAGSGNEAAPPLTAEVADIDQVIPSLIRLAQSEKPQAPGSAIVWTLPEMAVPAFASRVAAPHRGSSVDVLLGEVDVFADHILAAAARLDAMFVPTWTLAPYRRGGGPMNLNPDTGVGYALAAMNLRLMERLSEAGNVHVLDAQRWISVAGATAVNPKQWYMAKSAFSMDVFKEAAADIVASLTALRGAARKLLILDLDDTLWGGVVGDDGVDGLTLGGHDAAGEAFKDFQRVIKSLNQRGILLGIVSKNDEKVALDAIATHPEMVLKTDDFAGWRINWEDKAQNIADLTAELNLGLQSVVFIDDNPFERGRVAEALPEVLVPDWPKNPMLYVKSLENLRCFDTVSVTNEDLQRQTSMRDERARDSHKAKMGSLEDWLDTLDLTIRIEDLDTANLKRAAQLLNKTNQMNLRNRRLSESELVDWASGPGRKFWTFRVSDRFGDSGLTALLSIDTTDDTAEIADFVVSCRVFKRGVEETMLSHAVDYCRQQGLRQIRALLVPTAKNQPCAEFWAQSGLETTDPDKQCFVWDLGSPYAPPSHLRIEA